VSATIPVPWTSGWEAGGRGGGSGSQAAGQRAIKVERGDIVLFLEPDAAAQLMAEAPAGAVSSEIDLGQPLPARKVTARMAEGQATIELTAVQGDIKIRKVEVQR